MSFIQEIFKVKIKIARSILFRLLLFVAIGVILIVNSTRLELPLVGTLTSVAILYMISEAVGDVFFSDEGPVIKKMLGFAAFVVVVAFAGTAMILVAKFTELLSLILVVVLGMIFHLPYIFGRTGSVHRTVRESKKVDGSFRSKAKTYTLVFLYIILVSLSFYALYMGRTGEGRTSVWLTIPDFFLPVFLLSALFLSFTLFMTRIDAGVKIGLVILFSFLAHSVFMVVWYPGRYGDPWVHLGESRVIYTTGAPYAYERLLARLSWLDLIVSKTHHALVVLFTRMLALDIYWVHIAFVPFFWSFFTSLVSYKIADLLTPRRNTTIPLLATISALIVPTLIIWGAVSVPNSVGFIFFFITIFLILYWMNKGTKKMWVLAGVACLTAGFAHPQTGIFASLFLLSATVFKKVSSKLLTGILYVALLGLYPLALYLRGATLSLPGLLVLDNFLTFQSGLITLLFVFGVLGLASFLWLKGARGKNPLVLFVFYVTILVEYYLTAYGMKNLPFGPGRILVMAEFLILPFVAFGIFAIFDLFRKTISRVRIGSFGRFRKNPGSHIIAFLLISVFLSLQVTFTLYQTYPRKEIVDVQPAAYEVEAIRYIDSTAPGRYVALADTQFAGLASGILGADYSYGANPKGIVGIPEFWFRTYKSFAAMVANPSIRILQEAMAFDRASVAYFVVSVRDYDYLNVVRRTSEILPVDKIFGDGKLYVFKYPLPIVEETGPAVKVTFEDQSSSLVETKFTYMFRSEVDVTLTLSGHTNYNVTDYPLYWTFNELSIINGTKPVKFDDSSDINSFIYVKDLLPGDALTVLWQANLNYPNAVWKDESFRTGWHTHTLYVGSIKPLILTDGNVLSMSWDFTPSGYQYYYYVKEVNVSAGEGQSIIVRWKSTGPIAFIVVYTESGGQTIVSLGSESAEWSRTIAPLPSERIVSVMVGMTNLNNQKISGPMGVFVDYILIAKSA